MSIKKNLDAILYDKIKDSLISGDFMPGQKIYIDQLADQYGVSRTPVIQAIKRLESEKILSISSNGRVNVPCYTDQEMEDICHARLLLEQFAIQEICRGKGGEPAVPLDELPLSSICRRKGGGSPDQPAIQDSSRQEDSALIDRLDQLARQSKQAFEAGDYVASCKCDILFHACLVDGAGNSCISDLFRIVQGRFLTVSYLSLTAKNRRQQDASSGHFRLVEQLRAFDAQGACETARTHILSICKLIVMATAKDVPEN